jgi:type 1 fimbriae regulatory protein FimB/type 1 fimbriae regulatory protein FimE
MAHYEVSQSMGALPMQTKSHLRVVPPTHQSRSVAPRKREREYLTPHEVEKLIAAAKKTSRYPHRDATLILVIYRHGLRASEACDLEWSQVDFEAASLHVRRVKNGKPAVHPIRGDELRALRQLRKESTGPFVFMNERGTPFTTDALNRHIKRLAEKTSIGFQVHVHMLRHACGYKLANDRHDTRAIQDWLGHRSIQHTVRYTELSPTRFKDFWRD